MKEYILKTKCGEIKGEERENAYVFKGIPYATTERFELPVMTTHWECVYDATAPETTCFQRISYYEEKKPKTFYEKEFWEEKELVYAESPQCLNIITPISAKKCPVLVFIHGGGFETGNVGAVPYGDTEEYTKRGIVYVSLGYRLNIFSLYECGNYGLHDQITGIKWIKENIEAFGGNPEQITIMGQSAGAMSITDLCYTEKLKDCVKGIILMSGGGVIPKLGGPQRKEKLAPFWAKVREHAGAKTEEDMRTLPAKVLWEAWSKERYATDNVHVMQPGIDGDIIPDEPARIVKAGKNLDVPVMIGVTSQDFIPVVLYEIALQWGIRNSKMGRQPVYGYFFDRTLPGNCYKAFHSSDIWYMFGNMNRSWRPFTEKDKKLSAMMMDYVAAFVKTGNPNGKGLPVWEKLSQKQKGFRLFNGESDGMIYPASCRRKVWNTMLKDKGPM